MGTKPGITCPKCGAVVPVNRMYCDECGAEIEHDLDQVKATVDLENRIERLQAISKTIRWFLAAAFVLTIVGHYFRKAFKELPQNDIVAFATAPTVDIGEEECAGTLDFGVLLPAPKARPAPPPPRDAQAIDKQLSDDAFRRAAVAIRKKGSDQLIEALLVGDNTILFAAEGQADPTPIHLADIRRIRPLAGNRWEIEARTLDQPVRAFFPKPDKIQLHVLERRAADKLVRQIITLDQIQELKPL